MCKKSLRLRSAQGFTLLEVIMSFGIATVIFLGLLLLMMSVVAGNRLTGMQIAGTAAARSQAEEILSLANSAAMKEAIKGGADAEVAAPMLFLSYLQSNSLPANYTVTSVGSPMTRIVCTFPVNDPGHSPRDDDGNRVAGRAATGTMTVYLDESEVPFLPNGNASGSLWNDLSLNSSEQGDVGFDINADGKIHNGGLVDENLQFRVAGVPAAYWRIVQLPVDFLIEFADRNGKMTYSVDYRVIISDF